jgi:hypothetical protein
MTAAKLNEEENIFAMARGVRETKVARLDMGELCVLYTCMELHFFSNITWTLSLWPIFEYCARMKTRLGAPETSLTYHGHLMEYGHSIYGLLTSTYYLQPFQRDRPVFD